MEKITKIIKFLWPVATFCLFLFVLFNVAHAADSLGGGWDQYLKNDLPNFTSATDATGEDVAVSVIKRVIGLAKYFVGGVALLLGIIYGMSLVFSMGKEESITKHKKNFLSMIPARGPQTVLKPKS